MIRLAMALAMVLTACGDMGASTTTSAEAVAVPYGTVAAEGEREARGGSDAAEGVLAPAVSCGAERWSTVPLSPIGGDVAWDPKDKGQSWSLKSTAGYVWQTKTAGKVLFLEFHPPSLSPDQQIRIRKVRIRARTNAAGEYTRVDIIRRDLNGVNYGMVTGGATNFDNVTTEATVMTNIDNDLAVDPTSDGPDLQFAVIRIDTTGNDGTIFSFEGADVMWQACDLPRFGVAFASP